jgi:molybdenum cofactor cytidylyltransferase
MDAGAQVVGILLAAGRGARFDPSARRLKLLEGPPQPDGSTTPMAVAAARALRGAVGHVVAVVRHDEGPGQARLRALLAAQGCELVRCGPGTPEGTGTSIACGVRASAQAGGWIIALADMPYIRVDTIAAVYRALLQGAACAAPFHRGRRGHPVGFGAACGAQLAALAGDSGARAVLERHAPVRIDVDDPGVLADIDAPPDLLSVLSGE